LQEIEEGDLNAALSFCLSRNEELQLHLYVMHCR
jgi:hypothetical protein